MITKQRKQCLLEVLGLIVISTIYSLVIVYGVINNI